mgnify:CR=1 FL=1
MPQTQPIGQSLYDFLETSKTSTKGVVDTLVQAKSNPDIQGLASSLSQQAGKLIVGLQSDLTAAITGIAPGVVTPKSDTVIVGGKVTPTGKPDLVGSRSTIVTAPPEFTKPSGSIPDLAPPVKSITDQIFKSYRG